VRRDCEPDRAWLLGPLGIASAVCGGVSVFPCFIAFALVAVPLGVTTWLMAQNDLVQMRAGLMDPRGEPETRLAQERATMGAWLALLSATLWCGLIVLVRM
jgi:hypothetical protein